MPPLISVIIPVFNEEKRISRCLNSICRQTYSNLEIVVVDDDSTDDTALIVNDLIKQDNRIKYYKIPGGAPQRTNWRGYDINAGFAARNYGFKIAKGQYITTQDADDACLLNRIEIQYNLLKKYQATLVTVDWQQLAPKKLNQKFDIELFLQDHSLDTITAGPEKISNMAKDSRGVLMIEPWHKFIPFPLKWFPYTRKLFYRNLKTFPGADNCMLFNRTVCDQGIFFRPRNERTWGTPAGRGSGRDFVFKVAQKFNNNYYFKLPLYLWDVKIENSEHQNNYKYLKS